MRIVLYLLGLFVLLSSVADAAVIRLVDAGGGSYRLEGEDLSDVAALDLTLEYYPASLTISAVTQGAILQGMLFVSNLNSPGTVRIGVVGTQSISGSGNLAVLTVIPQTETMQFNSLNARLNDAKGESLAVSIYLPAPEDNTIEPEENSASETADSPRSFGGSVTGLPPADGSLSPERHTESQIETPPTISRQEAKGPRMTFVEFREFAASSPLNQMQVYRDTRTYRSMSELFDRDDSSIRQYPYPALSDGTTEVKIILPALDQKAPNLALSNAKLLRSGSAKNGEWVIRCLPTKGAYIAKIVVLGLEQLVEIPLVIAPPVDVADYPLDIDKIMPGYDVNADGEQSWLDDYILMVNLLQNRQKN
jgi:hypothetical protein